MKMVPAFAMMCVVGGVASAQHHEGPRRPPEEAFAACQDLREGDECVVTMRDPKLKGTCASAPDSRLVCRPSGPPPAPPNQP
jgi:hypothetical protein